MRPDQWPPKAGSLQQLGDAARQMQQLFEPAEGVGYSPGDPDHPRPEPAAQQMGADALAGFHVVPFEQARPALVDPDLGFILERDLAAKGRSNYGNHQN